MKIGKCTREQATLICAIAASGGLWLDGPQNRWTQRYDEIAREINADVGLSILAWRHVMRTLRCAWTREVDAEAEALLRTGWTP